MRNPFRRSGRKALGRGVTLIQAPRSAVTLHTESRTFNDIYKSVWACSTVCDWLGRNLATYSPAVFSREDGRDVRREDDPLASLLNNPVPGVSRFEFLRHLVESAALSGNGFAVMVSIDGRVPSLVPVPSHIVSYETAQADGEPDRYILNLATGVKRIPRQDMLHVRLFDPTTIYGGQSPIEGLRDLIAEDVAAGRDRRRFYSNSSRPYGLVERPETAPIWDDAAREAFVTEWAGFFADRPKGATGGDFATAVLEDGMKWVSADRISPKDAAFVEGRDQVLRAVAASLGVPHQLIGAESENLSAAARLIESTLAPYAALLEGAFDAQLLPRFHPDDRNVFTKLLRPMPVSDTQAVESLSTAVKAGWLTPNEARGAVGLPGHEAGDGLLTPSNVNQVGKT